MLLEQDIIAIWEEITSKHLGNNTFINHVIDYKRMNFNMYCQASDSELHPL